MCLALAVITLGVNRALAEEPLQVQLHPPEVFQQAAKEPQAALPFHQTIPLAQGLFHGEQGLYGLNIAGRSAPAWITPARLWPDGSVRLLRVHALWPAGQHAENTVPATIYPMASREAAGLSEVEVIDERTIHLGLPGQDAWRMRMDASVVPLLREKQVDRTTEPDYWDAEGQYHWVQPLAKVADAQQIIELAPVIREHTILQQTPLYREHLIEGTGGSAGPGSDLEWQLRILAYHHVPLFEMTLTWKVFWDPQAYALAEANARLISPDSLIQAVAPEMDLACDLDHSELVVYASADARVRVQQGERVIQEADGLDGNTDAWVVQVGDAWLGLALPRMGRLGPNHLRIGEREIAIAAWSQKQQAVLDLRFGTEPHEFGLDPIDLRDGAAGIAFSRKVTLALNQNRSAAEALARTQAHYGQYWFARRDDYIRSQALGPWRDQAFEAYGTYLQGLRANLHFLVRSRDRWRWTGLINYGDMRTNFALGRRIERGLYPRRWASHGRYGWRNGSGQPYLGLLEAALFFEDRPMALAALDYALHVADVDMRQPRRFGQPHPRTGGLHRRSKDHWSGSIQVQYTPSSGIYLAHWMTGEQRLAQATEAIRNFMWQEGRGAGSIFAASAWINHYEETHAPEALERARELLDHVVRVWEQRHPDLRIAGPAVLYYENFRRQLDGYPVLIEFFSATGDRQYLDHMLAGIHAHEPSSSFTRELAAHIGPAYLMAHGYTAEQIGSQRIDLLRQELAQVMPDECPAYDVDDYETLMAITTQYLPPAGSSSYRESASIGWRARNAIVVLSWFHTEVAGDASGETNE